MLTSYWGVTDAWMVGWPETFLAWLLLIGYGGLLFWLLYRSRTQIAMTSHRQWVTIFAFSLLAFFMSLLFPIQNSYLKTWLLPFSSSEDGRNILTLLSPVPYLITGALFGPFPALIVGFFTGLGRSFGLTHQLFDPFQYALAAWITGSLMQQNFQGRTFRILRLPVTNGVIGQISILLLSTVALFASMDSGFLAAIDASLFLMQEQFWLMFIEGLVGGLIATVFVQLYLRWKPRPALIPSPFQRSVINHLHADFLLYAAVMLLISTLTFFVFTSRSITRQRVNDMAASTNAAAAEITTFQTNLEETLVSFGEANDLETDDKTANQNALHRLYSAAQHFQRVLMVDNSMSVTAYPSQDSDIRLSEQEQMAVKRAVKNELKSVVMGVDLDGEPTISVVVPIHDKKAGGHKALIGRVPAIKLTDKLNKLESAVNRGTGLIINRSGQIIARSQGVNQNSTWIDPQGTNVQKLGISPDLGGDAFLMKSKNWTRDLIYIAPPNPQAWDIAMVVPYESVISQTFFILLPLFFVLLGVTAVSYFRLDRFGKDLTNPISELSNASKMIATGGKFNAKIYSNRQDEIGELSQSFTDMQMAMKSRLDELSLLLAVSQDISTSINVQESIPVVLQGALRGTGAAGARAVILNPNDRYPLAFSEGPSGQGMAVFDRALMNLVREKKELALNSLRQMRELPEFSEIKDPPVKALFAINLKTQNKFQGVLFLGFRQSRDLNSSERTLLHTLAGQAAVLVENAHLYANAESGRRRMAAVLASTSEAVIVTDRTNRILMINRAMERAFLLEADKVVGRSITDVIESERLVNALTNAELGTRDLQVIGKDRRSYFANAATIISQQGEIMGRVAVLHDITQIKELDRMKSDFVNSVSHDLRTPLTVMSGYATALSMMEDLSPIQRDYADNILMGVERMVGLVDNLLDLGRIEAGIDLHFDEIDVAEMLRELADEHWLYAHDGGVALRVETGPNLPKIIGDRSLLERAVSNLLSNGFKYAPNSGDMKLAANLVGNEVVISLRDHGPGIAKLDQMHLFEKFYRVKRHGSGKVKGSGLGLAIVHSVAERHGGSAWCQSALGKGSTFFIAIPVDAQKKTGSA